MSVQRLTVRDVMNTDPIVVSPDATVQEVLRLLNHYRIGAVMVAVDGRINGIFSERDFLRQAVEYAPNWRLKPVSEWMTQDPHTISPDAGWEDAIGMMQQYRVRHLPVIEAGSIVGIVSSRQLIGRRNEHLNTLVEQRTEELQKLYDEVSTRDAELRANMNIAGRLQARLLLPGSPPDWSEIRWGIHYASLDPLGGDYYDFAQPNDRQLGILIADAAGHSIAAAMVAIMARFAFTEIIRTTVQPAEVLTFMNRRLQGLTDERFVTAFYGLLDRQSREFRYATAGHPPPIRFNPNREQAESLSARGLMLGIVPHAQYQEKSLTLEVGDRLLFYTDGVIESRNINREQYGRERLERTLLELSRFSASEIALILAERLQDFRSDLPAWDDLSILIAEVAR